MMDCDGGGSSDMHWVTIHLWQQGGLMLDLPTPHG